MKEAKSQRFQLKASKIIMNAFNELEKFKGLTNRKYYDFTEEEIELMFSYLEREMDEIRSLFKKKEPFSFSEEA